MVAAADRKFETAYGRTTPKALEVKVVLELFGQETRDSFHQLEQTTNK
jgi:hypothetical protein